MRNNQGSAESNPTQNCARLLQRGFARRANAPPRFLLPTLASRAECEDRLRAEFRIEMNAAVAESEQRWQNKELELQTHVSELQAQQVSPACSRFLPPSRPEATLNRC